MRKLPLLLCVVALATFSSSQAQTGVILGDLECQLPGANLPVGSNDCEGWSSLGGTQQVVLGPVTTPAGALLPTSGNNFLEVANFGVGPASPTVPSGGGGGIYPFVAGTVSEAQLLVPAVPAFTGATAIEFDWYMATDEFASDPTYNDFVQVALIDIVTGQLLQTLLYVDTFDASHSAGTNTVPSAIAGVTPTNNYGDLQTTQVLVNPAYVGQGVALSVVVGNQGDSSVDTVFFLDQVRFLDVGQVFTFSLITTGGGVGDLTFGLVNLPAGATDAMILLSQTPAPGGLGTGPFLGLVPDSLFFSTLLRPSTPFDVFHFPAAASPYLGGNLLLPPGTLASLAGTTWEGSAFAYSAAGFFQQANFQQATF